jgi:hypothetical protein
MQELDDYIADIAVKSKRPEVQKWSVKNYNEYESRRGIMYDCDLLLNGVLVGSVELDHPGASPFVRVDHATRAKYEADAKAVCGEYPVDQESFIEVIFSKQGI